eukprot:CAMPEP_0202966888 /NCGR_PEP_ID=MMETSP1396-20130829/11526_1 /ASSEMBLY_ACC=CAM_ASM_000872 /TAXON_ID= /ORGANISM="Pseudokeronopsis sp., Strain Brazil" /LENGTH=200 /DNA_ID=CAMNT_0049691289 /DNA_START=88 /DNA_END=687 /DNA_ORIENTATION=-
MAFSGYKFKDADDIKPFCEDGASGKTFEWCKAQAKKLGCWVFCGYPQVEEGKLYNSQMVVRPDGTYEKSYKKSFLYETDETWASEGPGFEAMDLFLPRHNKSVRIVNCICMDINPYKFEAAYEEFELATFARKEQAQLLLFSSNWVDPNAYASEQQAVSETLNYWANRLIPLIEDKSPKPCYFVAADRVGTELGEKYMGS